MSSEVARILFRGEYSRFARGTCVAQTGLHFPQRRQSLMAFEIELIEPSCIVVQRPITLRDHVGDDRPYRRFHIRGGLAFGAEEDAETFSEIGRAGIETNGHICFARC